MNKTLTNKTVLKKQKGALAVEYIALIVFIAFAVGVGAYTMGNGLKAEMAKISTQIGNLSTQGVAINPRN